MFWVQPIATGNSFHRLVRHKTLRQNISGVRCCRCRCSAVLSCSALCLCNAQTWSNHTERSVSPPLSHRLRPALRRSCSSSALIASLPAPTCCGSTQVSNQTHTRDTQGQHVTYTYHGLGMRLRLVTSPTASVLWAIGTVADLENLLVCRQTLMQYGRETSPEAEAVLMGGPPHAQPAWPCRWSDTPRSPPTRDLCTPVNRIPGPRGLHPCTEAHQEHRRTAIHTLDTVTYEQRLDAQTQPWHRSPVRCGDPQSPLSQSHPSPQETAAEWVRMQVVNPSFELGVGSSHLQSWSCPD